MKFHSGEEMYDYLREGGGDLYCEEMTSYVFLYNDYGSLCVYYKIDAEEAKDLSVKAAENDEYWGTFLGAGGNQIYDSAEYIEEFIPEQTSKDEALAWCEENYWHDWIDTRDYGKEPVAERE